MKIYLSISLICLSLTACAQRTAQNENAGKNANIATPSASPTPTKAEIAKQIKEAVKEAVDERQRAINDFIAKNYKGWQYKGIDQDIYACDESSDEPCNLLLEKGKQEKVITVMFRRFSSADGTVRLVVFEARPIDLSRLKIEKIKEVERQSVLDNLDHEQCESVCDN
jgi:hypothetical protein